MVDVEGRTTAQIEPTGAPHASFARFEQLLHAWPDRPARQPPGTWNDDLRHGMGLGTDKETARELVNTYVDAGGNFFDTADLYTNGTSETWLGEFIAERGLRDAAVISTKFSYNAQPGNPNASGNG